MDARSRLGGIAIRVLNELRECIKMTLLTAIAEAFDRFRDALEQFNLFIVLRLQCGIEQCTLHIITIDERENVSDKESRRTAAIAEGRKQ